VRILHLTDRFSTYGGAHRHLAGIVSWLADRGHDVHVAAGSGDEPFAGQCHSVPGLDARETEPVSLDPLLHAVRPDVIHLHTVVNPWVLEWAHGRRAVITIQDHRYFCPGLGKWTLSGDVCSEPMSEEVCAQCFDSEEYFRGILSTTRRRLAALAGLRIVVLSEYMKGALSEVVQPEAGISVIPPFVHGLDANAAKDGTDGVLFVGRLTAHKGVRAALDAWQRSEVGLPLLVAGSGPLQGEVAKRGGELLGWLDRASLSRAYRRARALLLPSRWQEPFGIVGLEALSMGVPVAAWRSGGIPEWHPGPGLVSWGDVDALAAALREAVDRRAEPPRGYEADALMNRLVDVYRSVAA
jgi:glycosyltransferase involved in cell wall biosynthesis